MNAHFNTYAHTVASVSVADSCLKLSYLQLTETIASLVESNTTKLNLRRRTCKGNCSKYGIISHGWKTNSLQSLSLCKILKQK